MKAGEITVLEELKDIKKEVAFWMDVINNEHLSTSTKLLAERVLKSELEMYLNPPKPKNTAFDGF